MIKDFNNMFQESLRWNMQTLDLYRQGYVWMNFYSGKFCNV